MAKKTKENRVQVILECTESKDKATRDAANTSNRKGGVSRYYTSKNRKNQTGRLVLKKYNPVLNKHTEHKEIK